MMRAWMWTSALIPSPAFAAGALPFLSADHVWGGALAVGGGLFAWQLARLSHSRQNAQRDAEIARLHEELRRASELEHQLSLRADAAQSTLDTLPYPVWQRDSSFAIILHNKAYAKAVEGSVVQAGRVAELDKKSLAQARQTVEQNKPVSEQRHIVVGGERRLYEIMEIPLEGGRTMGLAIDCSDIDALKEDLDRHNSAMNDFLESSASAMAIYGSDMRLKSFNYAFVALWKFDETWLDSQPSYGEILENLRERRKLPEQANFQLFKQQQTKLFRDLINPKEEFFYLPDGRALRVLAIPHALGGVMFAYEDVTDRLALERSYNTLIAVQRETLDNLHEAVAVFGEDGRLKLSNPNYARLWGMPDELMKSEPHIRDIVERCKPLYVYEDWDTFKQLHMRQLQSREPHALKLELSNGKVMDWRKVPLPDGANLITYLDITDSMVVERSLRERNDALQEADRLKSQFLANVSYELRSPLTSISGFSEMLSQEYFGTLSEKQREYVDGIHQSSQRLMQLINDILDLASIEAGYMRLEVARFDIAAMIKSVSSLIQERTKEHGLKLKVECAAKIGTMLGDETRIKQILFNLLSNAIKFSQVGDKVSFGAKARGEDEIIIWVEDEGAGIPESEREAIFETFYRGKPGEGKGKSSKRSGTGLGLSIVKSFIEMHGGRIDITSEPGKGTRFECVFLRENAKLAVSS